MMWIILMQVPANGGFGFAPNEHSINYVPFSAPRNNYGINTISWLHPYFSYSCVTIPYRYIGTFPPPSSPYVCKYNILGFMQAWAGFWNAYDFDGNGYPDLPVHITEGAGYADAWFIGCLMDSIEMIVSYKQQYILYQTSPRSFNPVFIGEERDTLITYRIDTIHYVSPNYNDYQHFYGTDVADINGDGFVDIISVAPENYIYPDSNPNLHGAGCIYFGPTYTSSICSDSIYGSPADPKFFTNHVAVSSNPRRIFVTAEAPLVVDTTWRFWQALLMVNPTTYTTVKLTNECAEGVAVGDINNDGYDDVVCSTSMNYIDNPTVSPKGIYYLLGPSYSTLYTALDTFYTHDLIVYDINGDGRRDIVGSVFAGFDDGLDSIAVIVLYNQGGNPPTFYPVVYKVNEDGTPDCFGGYVQEVDIGDFNCDGLPDIITAVVDPCGVVDRIVYIFTNMGGYPYPNFSPALILRDTSDIYYGIVARDFDNDGYTDFAIPQWWTHSICFIWNNVCGPLGHDDELVIKEDSENWEDEYVEIYLPNGRKVYSGRYKDFQGKGIYIIRTSKGRTKSVIIK